MKERNFDLVVYEEEAVKKLITFCDHPIVKRYAYVKHFGSSETCSHFHFYFVVKGTPDNKRIEEILGLSSYKIFFNRTCSEDSLIRYFLGLDAYSNCNVAFFKTNIKEFLKYNAILAYK